MKRGIFLGLSVLIAFGIFVIYGSGIAGETIHVPLVTSEGKIFIIDEVGHYVMIQKANGKKVSLELTEGTNVQLNGEKISLDQLGSLKKGYSATADHFTNDSGMQQTTRLVVHREGEK